MLTKSKQESGDRKKESWEQASIDYCLIFFPSFCASSLVGPRGVWLDSMLSASCLVLECLEYIYGFAS